MGTELGNLVVRIGGDASQLIAELGKSEKALGKTSDKLDLAVKSAAALAATAGAVATALAIMVRGATNNADAMHKAAQAAGLATQTFSEYAHVARLSDVSTEALSTSIGRLNRNILDAASGTGEAVKEFNALGIQVKNADGSLKSADQVMEEVADQFAQMEDGAGKSGIAMMLFGRAGASMIPMLNGGSRGMRELREEARQLGVTIDTETSKAAEQFNDNLTRLGQVQQGLANRLMSELLPAMNVVTDAMVIGAKETGTWHEEIRGLSNLIQSAVLVVFQTLAVLGSDIAFVFKMIGGELGVWAAQLAALARGDFKGFRLISEEWTRDAAQARKDLDDFQRRIMALKPVEPVLPGGAMDMGGTGDGRKPAPALPDDKALAEAAKREQEIRDILHKVREEDDKRELEQIAKKNEEMAKMQDEALKARLAAIDWEQAEEIRRGQELLDTERAMEEERLRLGYTHRQLNLASAKTFFGHMSALMNTSSKKMFEIGKAAAIAETIVNTHAAAMGAYKALASIPYVGPFLGAAAAAAALAAGAVQISAIRPQSIGGGGGAVGTFPASPTTGQPVGTPGGDVGSTAGRGSGQTTLIRLQGDIFGADQIRSLLEKINESTADGGRIVLI